MIEDRMERGFISGVVFNFKMTLMMAYKGRKNIEVEYRPDTEIVVITADGREFVVNVAGDSPNAVLYDIYRQAPDIFFL